MIILKKDIIKEYIDKLYIEFEKNTMDEICNMIFEIRTELRNAYDELKTDDNCIVAEEGRVFQYECGECGAFVQVFVNDK